MNNKKTPKKEPLEPKTLTQLKVEFVTREDPSHEAYKIKKALKEAINQSETDDDVETYDDILEMLHENIELVGD